MFKIQLKSGLAPGDISLVQAELQTVSPSPNQSSRLRQRVALMQFEPIILARHNGLLTVLTTAPGMWC